jgi:hypothetical protein
VVSLDGSGPLVADAGGDEEDVCAPAGNTAPTPIAAVPHTAAVAIIRFRFIVVPPLVVEPDATIHGEHERPVNLP